MPETRRALIGGTVNLENYENFRYEFEGIITSSDDYVALGAFAGSCLLTQAGMASDPIVKDRIRKHVARVFGLREEDLPEVTLKNGVQGTPAEVPATAEPAPVRQALEPEKPAARPPETKASTPATPPAAKKAEPAAPAAPAKPPEPAPATKKAVAEKPAAGTCEVCGAPLTESQKKLSQLFMNKNLCKPCMDKSQGVST